MKKLIWITAFVTVGLFVLIQKAPSAQADDGVMSSPMDDGAMSSPMADHGTAVQAPMDLDCPASRPHCCEDDGNGHCIFCISTSQQCP